MGLGTIPYLPRVPLVQLLGLSLISSYRIMVWIKAPSYDDLSRYTYITKAERRNFITVYISQTLEQVVYGVNRWVQMSNCKPR